MTTRYNGREYSFQIYMHTISSIIPSLDMKTGLGNPVHVFSNGTHIHYRRTTLPNGTRIEIEAKKHHKQLYVDAVKSQLLYFDNIVFQIKSSSGATDTIETKAKILYEDEHIILSDNTQYSKPHLLINKVNYGYVDFRELELQDVQGNIGIKVQAEQVSVNPSREAVVWDETTKETIKASFETVVGIASEMISKQLDVDDFLEWIRAAAQIQSRYSSSDSIIGRLAKMVDLSTAKIKYKFDPKIIYGPNLFDGLTIRHFTLATLREGSLVKYHVDRQPISAGRLSDLSIPLYVMNENVSFKKDKYLMGEHPNGFFVFQPPVLVDGELPGTQHFELTPALRAAIEHRVKKTSDQPDEEAWYRSKIENQMAKVSEFLLKSTGFLDYDKIVVPEDFDGSEEITKEEEEAKTVEGKESKAMRSRAVGVIPIFTPRNATSSYANNIKHNTRLYEWQKLEQPIADIDKWDEEEVFYATDRRIDFDEDNFPVLESELLHLAALITRPQDSIAVSNLPESPSYPSNDQRQVYTTLRNAWQMLYDSNLKGLQVKEMDAAYCHNFWPGTRVKLIKVAQDRQKFFRDFKPIQKFFMDVKGKTLTMSNALMRWNTARIINQGIGELRFLNNFGVFHQRYATLYGSLQSYVRQNYREVKEHSKNDRFYGIRDKAYDELIAHCDKLTTFQLFVRSSLDKPEAIAEAAKDLFSAETVITDGQAVDLWAYDGFKELQDYAAPIGTLLNEVDALVNNKAIGEELEQEIRTYLAFKDVKTA